jgi:hypothetical protein
LLTSFEGIVIPGREHLCERARNLEIPGSR